MNTEISASKARLQQLRAEIERLEATGVVIPPTLSALLAEVEGAQAGNQPLHTRVQDELTAFEVSHPRLTAIANDILLSLGGLGI